MQRQSDGRRIEARIRPNDHDIACSQRAAVAEDLEIDEAAGSVREFRMQSMGAARRYIKAMPPDQRFGAKRARRDHGSALRVFEMLHHSPDAIEIAAASVHDIRVSIGEINA